MSLENPNYMFPPIPEGYKHVLGEWKTGFTIQALNGNFELGDYWTWVPVGYLDNNGTLDGKTFNSKFGRRNYRGEHFSSSEFNERIDTALTKTLHTIEKYGGFYISTYLISEDEDGYACSGPCKKPWTNIDFNKARHHASTLGFNYTDAHLCYGAEIDTFIEWLTKCNLDMSKMSPKTPIKGHLHLGKGTYMWTMEHYGLSSRVIRYIGDNSNLTDRTSTPNTFTSEHLGFRATLYIP